MRIQPISRVYNPNYAAKSQNFKGIIGKIRLFDADDKEENTYEMQEIEYFQFMDDSPKEYEELCAKYDFDVEDNPKPLHSQTIRFQRAQESEVSLTKVPLMMSEYKKYIDNQLTPYQESRVERILKDAGLRELLKKKIALLPLKDNLYKSLYLSWF